MTDIWPFSPLLGCNEEIEFKTEVMASRTSEQRLRQRAAPRVFLTYQSRLEDKDYSKAKILARMNGMEKWHVPNWGEATHIIGTVSSGWNYIPFDTAHGDYRVGSPVLLWSSPEDFVVRTITGIAPTYLAISGTLGSTFSSPHVMPVRLASTPDGVQADRSALISDVSARFQCHDGKDLSAYYASPYPFYQGVEVMVDRPWLVEAVSEQMIRATNYIDNGYGLVSIDETKIYTDLSQTLVFMEERPHAVYKRKLWLHSLYGRQKSFWLPSFANDFPLQANISAGAVAINVHSVGPSGYYINKEVMLERLDGTRYFRKIVNATSGANHIDTLQLSAALGAAVTVGEMRYISVIQKTRLAADIATFDHRYIAHSIVTIPTLGVPA